MSSSEREARLQAARDALLGAATGSPVTVKGDESPTLSANFATQRYYIQAIPGVNLMAEENVYTMANTKIFISENPVTGKLNVTPEDFQGITWIEMGGLFSVGELGGDQTINSYELINSDWVSKTKGTRDGGTMANVFIPLFLDPGQTKFREAIEDNCRKYAFRVERGADCAPESEVTVSVGAPAVVTWTAHGFLAGQPVMFTTDDTMPAGLTEGTVYYVVAAGLTENEFSVAAEPGGAPIETTSAGTGTVTGTAPPAGMTDMFQGLATDGARSGGERNAQYTRTYNIAVNGRIITI